MSEQACLTLFKEEMEQAIDCSVSVSISQELIHPQKYQNDMNSRVTP